MRHQELDDLEVTATDRVMKRGQPLGSPGHARVGSKLKQDPHNVGPEPRAGVMEGRPAIGADVSRLLGMLQSSDVCFVPVAKEYVLPQDWARGIGL